MKAKTTVNFSDRQLEALRSIMLNYGWATPDEDNSARVSYYRTAEQQEVAKALSDILDRADIAGITVEGPVRR